LEADVQREAGISAAEARYAARRLFGNTAQVKEQVRESWPLELARPPAADLRYAIRTMRSGGPIGTRISIDERDGESLWRQIVGIVGDTKQNNLAEPIQPEFILCSPGTGAATVFDPRRADSRRSRRSHQRRSPRGDGCK
jgi:hypothetical protein